MSEFNIEYEVALSKLLSARTRVRFAEQAYMYELAKFSMEYPNSVYTLAEVYANARGETDGASKIQPTKNTNG